MAESRHPMQGIAGRPWVPVSLSVLTHATLLLALVLIGRMPRPDVRQKPIVVSVRVPPPPVAEPVVAKPEAPKPMPRPQPKPKQPLAPPPPTPTAAAEPAPQKGDPTVAPVFGVRPDAVRLGGSFKVSVGNSLATDPANRGPLTSTAEPGSPEGDGVGARPVSLSQVTRMPRVSRAAKPRYPESLRRLGTEGTVRVEIVIDSTGAVTEARIVASPDPAFNDSALEAARKTVFVPALAGDEPVAIRLQIPVEFRLTD